ncbi:uncharacterized protein LTR77_004976 [Saxophila tyrrhenica]|uniref:Uncharacterized protein n=1 Tax=Saxophila tyrrhenica TaxID=1690608 RepID=A0AAV9PD40_9PEZI|nr:hypothetical protein LTR77_004976 [Saxophila tyrrhenica]
MIFRLATLPEHNENNIYWTCDREHHSDDALVQRYHTSLLLTCRLIWLETNELPLGRETHHFYFPSADPHSNKSKYDYVAGKIRERHAALWTLLPFSGKRKLYHLHYHMHEQADVENNRLTLPYELMRHLTNMWPSPPITPPKMITFSFKVNMWYFEELEGEAGEEQKAADKLPVIRSFVQEAAACGVQTVRIVVGGTSTSFPNFKDMVEQDESLRVARGDSAPTKMNPPLLGATRLSLKLPGEESPEMVDVRLLNKEGEVESVVEEMFCSVAWTWEQVGSATKSYDNGRAKAYSTLPTKYINLAKEYKKTWESQGSLLKFVE